MKQGDSFHPLKFVGSAIFAVLPVAVAFGPCGGKSDDGLDDPRAQGAAAFVTAAIDRYSVQGSAAFYDLLVEYRKATCSRESFVEAVADEPVPLAFRRLERISFDGSIATARIGIQTQEGDQMIEWDLYKLTNSSWRIYDVPGMEDCTSP